MIIAEELLLLAYDDATGRPSTWIDNLDYRLAGSLLVELAHGGRLDILAQPTTTPEGARLKAGTVVALGDGSAGHPALDHALDVVRHRPRKASDLVAPLAKNLRTSLLAGLAERGILRREETRVLKVFPRTSWPAVDSSDEERLRAECADALLGRRDPSPEVAALLAMAHGSGLIKQLVPADQRRAAEARAKQLSQQSWASGAVTKVVDEVNAAMMTAVMVAATAGAAAAT